MATNDDVQLLRDQDGPPDNDKPIIIIESPRQGEILSGPQNGIPINITGSVENAHGLSERNVIIDIDLAGSGNPKKTASIGDGFSWSYEALVKYARRYNITATLYNSSDKAIASVIINVQVSDSLPPSVLIISPQQGTNIGVPEDGKLIDVEVSATDPLGVRSVSVQLDENRADLVKISGSDQSGIWGGKVKCSPMPLGTRTISAKAIDFSNNESTPVDVIIDVLDGSPPTFRNTRPDDNARFMLPPEVDTVVIPVQVSVRDAQSGLQRLRYELIDAADKIVDRKETNNLAGTQAEITDRQELTAPRPGTYWVQFTFLDMANNSSKERRQVDVFRRIIPLNADDLIGPREYLRALLNFALNHILVPSEGDSRKFVDEARLYAEFGQNFNDLAISQSGSNVSPINQARICVEVLRRILAKERGVDTLPPKEYLLGAYQFLLLQLGTSYDELRLIRGADAQTRSALASRLGLGNSPEKLDLLLLHEDSNLSEEILQRRFGLPSPDTSSSTLSSVTRSEFFGWVSAQRQLDWAVADRDLPYPLIDPDVIGKVDLIEASDSVPILANQLVDLVEPETRIMDSAPQTITIPRIPPIPLPIPPVPSAQSMVAGLWQNRKSQIEEREASLRQIVGDRSNRSQLEIFNALMVDIYPQWASPKNPWDELRLLVERGIQNGQKIDAVLTALGLNLSALRRLHRIGSLAEAAQSRNDVTDAEFDDVIAILIRVWKIKQFATWRGDESDLGISISPKYFKLYQGAYPVLPNTGFKDGVPIAKGNESIGWWVSIPGQNQTVVPRVTVTQPYPQWLPNDDLSHWINPTNDGNGNQALPVGTYIYQTRIDLTGWDLSTVEIIARIAVDDKLSKIVVSSPEGFGPEQQIPSEINSMSAFTAISIDASKLFRGLNDLAFHVVNAGTNDNPTGLRVEFGFAKTPQRIVASPWRLVAPTVRVQSLSAPSTGQANLRPGYPDPYWSIPISGAPIGEESRASSGTEGFGFAMVSSSLPASWLSNDPSIGSRWISPTADANRAQPIGRYVYQTDLDLTDWDLSTMELELRVAVDSTLTAINVLAANGTFTSIGNATGPGSLTTIKVDRTALQPGINRIEFHVTNDGNAAKPTGLRVEFVYVVPPVQKGQSWSSGSTLREDWQNRLASRIDQTNDWERATVNAAEAAEQASLPVLRDSLISRYASLKSLAPSEAAEHLGQRLLMETRGNAWRTTSRVQQATESLQTLIQGLRDRTFPAGHPTQDWTLAIGTERSDNQKQFDDEWSWLGNYTSWRSAMLIFYYPENMLLPGLRPDKEQSEAFKTLMKSLRDGKSKISPVKAETLADHFLSEVVKPPNLLPSDLKITGERTPKELDDYRKSIKTLWDEHADQKPLLEELLYGVPMAIALQLQKAGEFDAALDWYRTVYTYNMPDDDQRKVFPGLREEKNQAPTLNQSIHWLREQLDPYSFARQRWPWDGSGSQPTSKQANPYTRFTMMSIARCLLEYGDAEFTRDKGEALANARALYMLARDILNRADFDQLQPDNDAQVLLPNPILGSLRARVAIQLFKMRQGRNVAGVKREIELSAQPVTLTGIPTVGTSGQIVVQRDNRPAKPTPYRFAVLMERAKQMVSIAQQMEGAYLSALEKIDIENYNLKKAGYDLDLAAAGFTLQQFRVNEANSSKTLATTQKSRAAKQKNTYQGWISEGLSSTEIDLIALYESSGTARSTAAIAEGVQTTAQLSVGAAGANVGAAAAAAAAAIGIAATVVRTVASVAAAQADAQVQVLSLTASHEQREREWGFARDLAAIDEEIGEQQIRVSDDHINVATQEKNIADTQQKQASDMKEFLTKKFANAELYEWMSGVLGNVYSYFLQQATAVASLAQQQLTFERQESPGNIIQSDYWEVPAEPGQLSSDTNKTNRRGLTGSARLLQDIYMLDQLAFDTNRRKQNIAHTISLARRDPYAFSVFRETGVLYFTTPLTLFDEAFPGHYLRLIKRVRTSVVALIPPVAGIRATLTASGISRVVTGGDVFQELTIRRDPESVALSSPLNATGVFELDVQSELLLPFESMGVATSWQFEMPKAANAFDFNTIADVLVTIEYTALASDDYRRQVIQKLPKQVGADKNYSVRDDLPDLWYSLSNPAPDEPEPIIQLRSERSHFPPNLRNLSAVHLLFAVIPNDQSATTEGKVSGTFRPDGSNVLKELVSLPLTERRISSRLASGSAWGTAIANQSAIGTWQFRLSREIREAIAAGTIQDILFVETFSGTKPEWPS